MPKSNLIVVCGPTASGKTSLAVKLAGAFNGEIISADSRQVYRGLDIGSGKDLFEYAVNDTSVPYHLIDIADPKKIYTLYHYQKDFYRTFDDITSRKKSPVFCGGTGLYIEAVLRHYALSEIPEDPELREELMTLSRQSLDAMLRTEAPDLYEKTDLNSKKRIVRALEIARSRNDPRYQKQSTPARPELHPVVLCTRWPREKLLERINARLSTRLSEGMVDEVRRLRMEGVTDKRLFMFGMEYKFITKYLCGELDFDTMVEQLKISIHRLSKRQVTWFRGMERRGFDVHWIDEADFEQAREVVEKDLSLHKQSER